MGEAVHLVVGKGVVHGVYAVRNGLHVSGLVEGIGKILNLIGKLVNGLYPLKPEAPVVPVIIGGMGPVSVAYPPDLTQGIVTATGDYGVSRPAPLYLLYLLEVAHGQSCHVAETRIHFLQLKSWGILDCLSRRKRLQSVGYVKESVSLLAIRVHAPGPAPHRVIGKECPLAHRPGDLCLTVVPAILEKGAAVTAKAPDAKLVPISSRPLIVQEETYNFKPVPPTVPKETTSEV